jgi:hypothetical protein
MLADLALGRSRFTLRSALYAGALVVAILSVVCAILDLNGFAVLFIVLSTLGSVMLGRYDNMFHMTWLTGHVVFSVVPSLICLATAFPIAFELPALCSLLTVVAVALTDRPPPAVRSTWKPSPSIFVYVTLIASAVMVVSRGESFLFSIPLLVLIYSVAVRDRPLHVVGGLYALLMSFVLLYAVVYWDGFGRLILAGTLIIPSLLLVRRLGVPFGKYAFLVVAAAAGLFGTLLRFRDTTFSSILRTTLSDSNSAPLLLGQSFIERGRDGGVWDPSGWFDQVILIGLAVWPREWWREKPLGFGAAWVADNMGPGYWGHSIASTFMGEHLYYLGLGWGVVAAFASVVLIAQVYNAMMRSRYLFGLGGYLVAVYLPTFYWGGMASFATRFWIGLVPLIGAIILLQLLKITIGAGPRVARSRLVRSPGSHGA